jgi:hypothetical protein
MLIVSILFTVSGFFCLAFPRAAWGLTVAWNELWGYEIDTTDKEHRVLYTRIYGACALVLGSILIWMSMEYRV